MIRLRRPEIMVGKSMTRSWKNRVYEKKWFKLASRIL